MEFHKGELSWYIAIEVERNKHRVTRIQWHSVGHRSTLNWPLQLVPAISANVCKHTNRRTNKTVAHMIPTHLCTFSFYLRAGAINISSELWFIKNWRFTFFLKLNMGGRKNNQEMIGWIQICYFFFQWNNPKMKAFRAKRVWGYMFL